MAQKPPQAQSQPQVVNTVPVQAPIAQTQPQAFQTPPGGLSPQQKMTLDDIANEITTIRISLSSMELAIKKLKQ